MNDILRTYNIADDDVVILISIVMFAMYAFVMHRGRSSFLHKWMVFFTGRKASGGEYAHDTSIDIENNIIMLVLLGISTGFLFYDRFSPTPDGTISYSAVFILTGILIGWLLVKSVLYWVINWVFADFDINLKWGSSYFFLTTMVSLVAFPLSVIKLFFQLDCSTIILLCFILLLIYKILLICKLTSIFKPKSYGFVLIFLYFCTLELMPAMFCWYLVA